MALQDWYANREVLLTGVTSELGRALLEKILRAFRTVKVHVVLRSRGGFNVDQRIENIFASRGYERLRLEDPKAINRVTSYEGNLVYDDLKLRRADIEAMRNVSVVFHAAGPHSAVLDFCQELPNLEAVAAASTIFRHKGQIAEKLQNEYVPDVPLALVRIPMIGPAYNEPMPGFVELLKGPTAFMIGAGYALGRAELDAAMIPSDIAVNTLIVAAWEKGNGKRTNETLVYNAATIGCTWGDLVAKGQRASRKFAYPTFGIRGMTSIVSLHWTLVFFLEWLPSFLCDAIFGLFGRKRRILTQYDRVRNALRRLESISSRPWLAERNRVYVLQERLPPLDRDAFPVCAEIDVENYVLCAAATASKHCVDEGTLRVVRIFRSMIVGLTILLLLCVSYLIGNDATRVSLGSRLPLD